MAFSFRTLVIILALSGTMLAGDQKPAAKEGWLEVRSAHFSVITDAGEKRGREVALRLEQMRAVFGQLILRAKLNMPIPVQVLALKNDNDYAGLCPLQGSRPISAPGFFLAGEDRDFIVLDLFSEEPWRAIAHPMAHMLLDGNYPPTQAWFDEGLAEYFSSIRVDNKAVDIGGDPELSSKYSEDLMGNVNQVRNPSKSLTELLSGPLWLKTEDLLAMRLNAAEFQEGTHNTLFYAQSWMVMHYLLSKKMLPQVGTYFGLVQNQKVPVAQALQQAFGMTPDQFEKAVKDYFQSLTPLFTAQDKADASAHAATSNTASQVSHFPAPFGPDDVAMVVKKINDDDAHALTAEVMARQPEHREQGLKDLQALAADPIDDEWAHRALAYAYIQQKKFKQADDELDQAAQDNPNDPWMHYYFALLKFSKARATGEPVESLANVQQGLRTVIDWNPQFADAYHLLGLAELEGGGTHAAGDSIRTAIQLSPRNEWYVMNLADVNMEGKRWDDAQAILERLKSSSNSQVASAARKKLEDLPFVKKYGIPPERAAEAQKKQAVKTAEARAPEREKEDTDSENAEPKLKERTPDKRPVHYLKGRIVSVDCSQPPAATLTVSSGGKILKLHTDDSTSLVVIGADEFSCAWRNRPVSVNYKANGKSAGDLVSLEVE